jgi:phosphatidylethanolamine/phosphatidyl-N-methylethanolamine N-methyltransferase
MSRIEFFKHFVKKPGEIGAICPSSPYLAKTIISDIDIDKAKNVVEIGPGTGAFTNAIIDNIPSEANFFVIELNSQLYSNFQKKFPDVKAYNNCASELSSIMKKENIESIDAVISGLPWAAFPEKLQHEIMDAIFESLAPGGVFTTFAYLQGFLMKAAHRFRDLLKDKFETVETSRTVWRNFPPAFVYRCRKEK